MTKNKTVGAALVAALYFALPHAAHAYRAPGGGEIHVTKCKDQGECYDQARRRLVVADRIRWSTATAMLVASLPTGSLGR
jgi:hypothetical protein